MTSACAELYMFLKVVSFLYLPPFDWQKFELYQALPQIQNYGINFVYSTRHSYIIVKQSVYEKT